MSAAEIARALNGHRSGQWPAMMALVCAGSDNRPQAIHRTYLARDGVRKAPVDPQKMMLGPVAVAPSDWPIRPTP